MKLPQLYNCSFNNLYSDFTSASQSFPIGLPLNRLTPKTAPHSRILNSIFLNILTTSFYLPALLPSCSHALALRVLIILPFLFLVCLSFSIFFLIFSWPTLPLELISSSPLCFSFTFPQQTPTFINSIIKLDVQLDKTNNASVLWGGEPWLFTTA